MHEHYVGEHVVRARHYLSDYMPALAATLVSTIGAPREGSITRYLSDILKLFETSAAQSVFPPNLSRMGRSMRVFRLLDGPVQVDDVVMHLESEPKRRMYQKTKRLVLTRGRLKEAPGAQSLRSAAPPDLPPALETRRPPDAPPSETSERNTLTRSEFLAVADLYERLSAVEMKLAMDGVPELPPDFFPLARHFERVVERLDAMEQQVLSLAMARPTGDAAPRDAETVARLGRSMTILGMNVRHMFDRMRGDTTASTDWICDLPAAEEPT